MTTGIVSLAPGLDGHGRLGIGTKGLRKNGEILAKVF
jgi:hypothetical protein